MPSERNPPLAFAVLFCLAISAPTFFAELAPLSAADDRVVELKFLDRTTHYRSGAELAKRIRIEYRGAANADWRYEWRVQTESAAAPSGTNLLKQSGAAQLPAGEPLELTLRTVLPEIQRDLRLAVSFELIAQPEQPAANTPPVARIEQRIKVYAARDYHAKKFFSRREIGVLGALKIFEQNAADFDIQWTRLIDFEQFESFTGSLIIIAPDALSSANKWRDFYTVIHERPLMQPVLVMRQTTILPIFSRPEEKENPDAEFYAARIAAPAHPAFETLDEHDFSGWQPEGIVGRRSIPWPAAGNFRSLLVAGSDSPVSEVSGSLLLEYFPHSDNHVVFCQLPFWEVWSAEPIAPTALFNLMKVLISGAKPDWSRDVCYLADPESPFLLSIAREWLGFDDQAQLPEISWDEPVGSRNAVLLDASTDALDWLREHQAQISARLSAVLDQRGIVVLFGANPDSAEILQELFADQIEFSSASAAAEFHAAPDSPLLSGLAAVDWRRELVQLLEHANAELYFVRARETGRGDFGEIVAPGLIATLKLRQGTILFFQPDLKIFDGIQQRIIVNQLLTNLGVRARINREAINIH